MEKRKKKLINKPFQLNLSFSIIILTFIVSAGIITLIAIYVVMNKQSNTVKINQLDKVITVEDNIVQAFITYSKSINNKDLLLASKEIETDHTQSMDTIKEHIASLKGGVEKNYYILTIFIVLSVLQIIIILSYLIRRTHRIAGPIYIINQHLNDILEGKAPDFRGLRQNDDFKELYEKLEKIYLKMGKE